MYTPRGRVGWLCSVGSCSVGSYTPSVHVVSSTVQSRLVLPTVRVVVYYRCFISRMLGEVQFYTALYFLSLSPSVSLLSQTKTQTKTDGSHSIATSNGDGSFKEYPPVCAATRDEETFLADVFRRPCKYPGLDCVADYKLLEVLICFGQHATRLDKT